MNQPTCKMGIIMNYTPLAPTMVIRIMKGPLCKMPKFCAEQLVGTYSAPPSNAQHRGHPHGNITAEGQKIKWAHALLSS